MIWRHWISKAWRRPEFEFVHQALVDYFVRRGIPLSHTLIDRFKDAPWFPERSGLWTKEQAAQVLGISERMRDVFLPQDPLGRCMAPESRARFPIFSRDKVLAVKKQWEEGLPLGDAAWWLGLERTDVIKLVERGELSLIRGQQDEDPGDWILEKQSLVAFFEAIDGQLKLYQDDPRELICLFEAFHLTSWEGVGKLALLKGIADGVLPGYKQEPSLRCLARVHFLRSTVTQLPKLIYAQRGWISGYAFALQKGLSLYTIDEWMKLGLLEPVATFNYRHYFDVQSIERVAAVYPPRR
jgi:hypothetical protein